MASTESTQARLLTAAIKHLRAARRAHKVVTQEKIDVEKRQRESQEALSQAYMAVMRLIEPEEYPNAR